jgi:outer membrane protein
MMTLTLPAVASVWLQVAAAAQPTPPAPAPAAPPPGVLSGSPADAAAAAHDPPVPAAPSTAALLASAATSRPILALDAAERTAMEHQPTIRQARFATAAAGGTVEQARSGYLPQVTGAASYTYGNESSSKAPSSSSGSGMMSGSGMSGSTVSAAAANGAGSSYAATLSASQLIYDFGQTTEKWNSAKRSVESLQATENTTRNQVIYNVRSAFFTARADRALVRVQMETLKNEQKHLVQTEGFVQVGTQPEISLAQTRTDLANAKVALIQAENNYDIARAQLNQAMGVTASVDYDVADQGLGAQDGEDDSVEQLVSRALANRPELAALTKAREADALTIQSLKGGYGPSLYGLGGVGLLGTDITTLQPAWQIGLSLTWPILLGGYTEGAIRNAEGTLGVADTMLEAERLQVRLDVEQGRLSVRSAKVSIGAAEEALVNAREQLRLAEASYSQGVGNIIQLGDAQVAVTSAGAQRVQADYNLAIARAQLLLALGRP